MKPLLKVMLILAIVFGSTFVLGRVLGILTVDNVKHWLEVARTIHPLWIIGTVFLLLMADMFVAVPTLTITILAGHFLGFQVGAVTAIAGMYAATFSGYWISAFWGDRVMRFLIKEKAEREELSDSFSKNGPAMIMLSRAAPMVPEITACLAGATRMGIVRYTTFFAIGTLPYVLIAAYAGSVSTTNNPMPAIYAALGLYAVLWLGWFVFQRNSKKHAQA